jgi:MerR family transcriptional regulator, copper efflux regulator
MGVKDSQRGEFVIGGLANLSGYSPAMIRYFEKLGVITPSHRTETGYRLFGHHHVEELRFVREMQDLGFPAKLIKTLREVKSSTIPILEKREAISQIFQEHTRRIEEKTKQLIELQVRLKAAAPDFVDRVLEHVAN